MFVKADRFLIDYFGDQEKNNANNKMNIDLFLTPHNEAGLVCAGTFDRTVVGVILDAQTQDMTLEFADMGETFHMNIPIEETHREKLLFSKYMFIGFLDGGLLADSYEIPLLYLNDPYGSDFGQNTPMAKPKRSIIGFEAFMKRCTFAQALNRDNLGDEDTARSVLRGVDPNHLQYTPALLRQRQIASMPENVAVSAPQMPGLGGTANVRQTRRKATDKKDDE